MKALRIHSYGGALQVDEIAAPVAGPGQVIVNNQATSFNPIDPGRASGAMRQMFPLDLPWTPGGDIAGTIASVGQGVTNFKIGDAVFGYSMSGGAYAEQVRVDAGAIAKRPNMLPVPQAAAVAVVGQTATQALQLAGVTQGSKLLIQGGSGGVGTLALQIAHRAGAHVSTTYRGSQKQDLLRLGADIVLQSLNDSSAEGQASFDSVLDLVGGETLARSYALVKRGGTIVTANQPPDAQQCEALGIRGVMVQTKVTTEGLEELAARVSQGELLPVVGTEETLWNPSALWEKRAAGSILGKIVFSIAE